MKAFTGALSYIAERDIELAMLLLASSWVADGISPEERYTLETIDHISGNDGRIAKELVASQWIADGVDSSETYVLDALLRFSEHPDSYSQLTSQPWFIDGLDDEEAVFVIALGGAASRSLKLFKDLLTAHYIQHRTISVPLAGEVNIWIIQNSPRSPGEDVLTVIEDHIRISEEFMGAPFPVADVILLHVDPRVGDYGLGGGWHSGSHFVAVRRISGGWGPVSHEMGHYYFNFGPRWLVEGGANFIAFYIVDDYEDWRSPLLRNSYCLNDSGIENLRHFSYWEATPGIDRRVRGCVYNFGENFLVGLLRTIGREAMSSALRELHLSHSELSQAVSEEDVYQAFLNHTPSQREEQFVDLYRNLHGGAFAFPDTDFSDEHSDSAEGASPVSVGGAVEGSLDYMFDFDFFWFRAEKGQTYRVHVEHETLRSSNVNLYAPDRKTLLARNWMSRSSTPYGPQIIWTAPSSGRCYIAVQNFGGQTGQYTLTITEVDALADDHGDNLAGATQLSFGNAVEAIVDDDLDSDYFRFQAEAGQAYRIDVTEGTLESFEVWLYDSNGAAVRVIRDKTYLERWVAPRSGPYYILLRGAYYDIGKYKLKITQTDN